MVSVLGLACNLVYYKMLWLHFEFPSVSSDIFKKSGLLLEVFHKAGTVHARVRGTRSPRQWGLGLCTHRQWSAAAQQPGLREDKSSDGRMSSATLPTLVLGGALGRLTSSASTLRD